MAKKIGWFDTPAYKETISGAHHSYPYIESMDKDSQLGDTILHKAGYIIREAVEDGMESEKRKRPDYLQTPG